MSEIEGNKKPYQPSEEEIKKAEEMIPPGTEFNNGMREDILNGRYRGGESKGSRTSARVSGIETDNIEVVDGKIMAARRGPRRGLYDDTKPQVEISIEEAFHSLENDEETVQNSIEYLETVLHRLRQEKQKVLALKEEQEKK